MKSKAAIIALIALWTSLAASPRVSAIAVNGLAPTPTPTVSRPRILGTTPTPLGTPEPANVTPTPTPVPPTGPTLLDLQSSIRQRLVDPAVSRSRVGVKIVSLASGKVVYEQDADKYFIPASNMKNFTVAAAFERLGPNFKFITSVYAAAPIDPSGTVKGDLRIYGRGDISMSTSFATASGPDAYYERIDRLATSIAAAGVKRIEGSLVADESYFRGNAVPYTWEWDDLQWKDGEEVSALPINNNALDLTVSGTRTGQPCSVTLGPPTPLYQVINQCVTGGSQEALVVKKSLDKNIVTISGSIPAGRTWNDPITFTRPADLFVAILKERLEKKGIVVAGSTRTLPPGAKPLEQVEIAKLESPPFREIAAKTMKPSQNMYTETILWTLGEQMGATNGRGGDSYKLGLGVVRSFLQQAQIPLDAVVQYDGSGMSRHDLITPSAVTQLYTYMAKQSANAAAWRASLTVAGVDGTLRNRFKGTRAQGNMMGKTGTLDQVSALSGYVTTASGEQLVISIIVNNMPTAGSGPRTSFIDDIVVQLANYTGRID